MQSSLLNKEKTIVALATPQGEGAISIIRLSGDEAITICNDVFKGKDLLKQPSHTIHFGTIRDNGHIIDEVLVSIFKAPKSYTREDVVEVSCHGSSYIQQELIKLFIKKGAKLAKPGEFTLRAFLNGQMDLAQAEAVADLIAADSASAHQTAMRQMRGGISNEISKLREELIHFASMIELELDFSEEDVEFADRRQLIQLVEKIQKLLRQLADSFQLGNAIKKGVTTVIAGRPNAGKSTLLNALLNEERAIVSEIPGTTRDTIEEVLNINGINFRFVDTAGIRDASDKIEAIGVEKTLAKIKQSAVVVYLFDVNELSPEELKEDIHKLDIGEIPLLVVGNKIDLGADITGFQSLSGLKMVFLSSKEKENLDELKEQLLSTVLNQKSSIDTTVVTNARHYEALSKAAEALDDVLNGIHSGVTGDLLALDIRKALHYLGEITGEISTDDLLGNIFSKFCIGK